MRHFLRYFWRIWTGTGGSSIVTTYSCTISTNAANSVEMATASTNSLVMSWWPEE